MSNVFERGDKRLERHVESFNATMQDSIALKSPHRLRMEKVLVNLSNEIYKKVILNSRRVRTKKQNLTDDQLIEQINSWVRELMELNPLNRRL